MLKLQNYRISSIFFNSLLLDTFWCTLMICHAQLFQIKRFVKNPNEPLNRLIFLLVQHLLQASLLPLIAEGTKPAISTLVLEPSFLFKQDCQDCFFPASFKGKGNCNIHAHSAGVRWDTHGLAWKFPKRSLQSQRQSNHLH